MGLGPVLAPAIGAAAPAIGAAAGAAQPDAAQPEEEDEEEVVVDVSGLSCFKMSLHTLV